ncbi:unnamed protein product [Linum tenue]|uniref:Uncharacterized protein n=1 Tax=Linum tenue TaxID=586396 RepID=A0AAV0GWB5_9ROSI|nr:unnamed protein product [Linum tenue]
MAGGSLSNYNGGEIPQLPLGSAAQLISVRNGGPFQSPSYYIHSLSIPAVNLIHITWERESLSSRQGPSGNDHGK